MIIVDVQSIPVGDFHFVRVMTDDGKVGLGSSSCWAYPQAVDEVINVFRPALIGNDPMRVEYLWYLMYRMGSFRGSVLSAAVSAVDIALWDLRGQHYKAPLWELLGGPTRERIRLSALLSDPAPEERLRSAQVAVAEGFTAVKFSVLPDRYEDFSYFTTGLGDSRHRLHDPRSRRVGSRSGIGIWSTAALPASTSDTR